ncbi:protein PFC0760c [Calliphora vicina]|uniref:protein PFC0760c n=1 Tax=Calliphora vicina TaxID=7373 RepID=UPI00325BB06B
MTDCNNSAERCVLCLDQKRSPVRIHCGHSFCFGCLDVYKSYRKYPWANKCPICRDVLKEKRTTKRKYSEINVGPESTNNNNLRTEIENNSGLTSTHSVTSQQTNILEEFMALAADYDYSGEAEYSMEDLSQDNEDYEHNDFGNDSYEEELNYYTDTDDDDDDNYYYFNNQEDYDLPSRNSEHLPDDSYQHYDEDIEVINDDNDEEVSYQSESLMSRDWQSNSLNRVNSEIDWETVIANEVIIID